MRPWNSALVLGRLATASVPERRFSVVTFRPLSERHQGATVRVVPALGRLS